MRGRDNQRQYPKKLKLLFDFLGLSVGSSSSSSSLDSSPPIANGMAGYWIGVGGRWDCLAGNL